MAFRRRLFFGLPIGRCWSDRVEKCPVVSLSFRVQEVFAVTIAASGREHRDARDADVFSWNELPELLAPEDLFDACGTACDPVATGSRGAATLADEWTFGDERVVVAGDEDDDYDDEEDDDEDEDEDDDFEDEDEDEEDSEEDDEEWEEVDDEEEDDEEDEDSDEEDEEEEDEDWEDDDEDWEDEDEDEDDDDDDD